MRISQSLIPDRRLLFSLAWAGRRQSALLLAVAAAVTCLSVTPTSAGLVFVDNLDGNDDFSAALGKVARASQDAWSGVFDNNNRQDGTNQFTISWGLSDSLETTTLAATSAFQADDSGIPISATININADTLGNDRFFLDATPRADEEYTRPEPDDFPNFFTAKPAAVDPVTDELVSTLFDLYSTLLHEVAHAIGFAVAYDKFEGRLTAPNPQAIRNYEFGDSDDFAVLVEQVTGTHIEPAQTARFDGMVFSQQHALMIPSESPGERTRIDDLTVAILQDAYGYTLGVHAEIPEPSSLALLLSAGSTGLFFVLLTRIHKGASS